MTTSTPHDPAICSLCHRAHDARWKPRHLFVPMAEAESPARVALDLGASRAATAERTRTDRTIVAVKTLEACGLTDWSAAIHARRGTEAHLEETVRCARHVLAAEIRRLSFGSDEPKYNAALTARRALGALWEVL